MIEQIGNVKLDLEYYPGEDKYCDGDVEDELLEIVKNNEPEQFEEIIVRKHNWPVLYHLSQFRGNIIEWFPIDKNAKVLEIGSGCGAITGTLADKCKEVTCVDLSKKRSQINAYRNKNRDNITIKVGNFQDIEPSLDTDYDVICLIGVFEYAAAYISSEKPYEEFLTIIKKHVKDSGQIVIAIENRMGLKYLAGCAEDHLGSYFSGVENYPNGGVVRTFTRNGLEKILRNTNTTKYSFYYPYPDYKFPHTIFSDKRLPGIGELSSNIRNFDRERMLLFDEKLAFDSVISDGEFPYFSNSYFLLIGSEIETVYSKYSNDRAEKYCIRTDIAETKDGRIVRKAPTTKMAAEHVNEICECGELLKDRYNGNKLEICPSRMENDSVVFPFLKGETLEAILDKCVDAGDVDKIYDYLKEYYSLISFGEEKNVTDYDLIFSNVLIDENNNWKVIDYEWTYKKNISSEDIFKRALYSFWACDEKRKIIDVDKIFEMLRMSKWNLEKICQDETNFQKTVMGERISLGEVRHDIGNRVFPLDFINEASHGNASEIQVMLDKNKVQIYEDLGNGFSEAQSRFVFDRIESNDGIYEANPDYTIVGTKRRIRIRLNRQLKQLRFDPCMFSAIISLDKCYFEKDSKTMDYPIKKITHSGISFNTTRNGKKNLSVMFNHNDANFVFNMIPYGEYLDGDFVIEYYVSETCPEQISLF